MRAKTTKQFKEEVHNLVNNEYTVMGEYKNNQTKIQIRHNCDKCNNHEYLVRPDRFLRGDRCPKCNIINKTKTTDQFKEELYKLVGDEYTVLGEYKNNEKKIKIRHNCDKCNNYEYMVRPYRILEGDRCPKCSNSIKKTTDQFKEELYKLVGDEYTVLGEYKNNKTDILLRHNSNRCNNYEYMVRPNNFLVKNNRCPMCANLEKESRAIKHIKDFLNIKNLIFEQEKTYLGMRHKNPLKIDILYNDINIEYDGEQHFFDYGGLFTLDIETIQKRDKSKNDFCLNKNLHLIRIPYISENKLDYILDAIINYNEEILINFNCLIIRDGELINKPKIYEWYRN